MGQAEAEAMSKRADAYKEYEEAATLEFISRLPDIAGLWRGRSAMSGT